MINGITTLLKSCLIFSIIFLFFSASCTKNSEPPISSNQKHNEVTLSGTEKRSIHSNIVGVDYEIYISLPYSYHESDEIYPVLYCLDANRSYGLVSNMVNILNIPYKEIPEILVVGIGYPIKGLEDWGAWRWRDLTPTSDPEADKEWEAFLCKFSGRADIVAGSGGAPNFLKFIHDELFPFIESNYRASSTDRALMGHSAGGLFALYTVFQHPEMFQRYFATSPGIEWDNGILFKSENEYASNHKDLPVRLFMSTGSLENEAMIKNMMEMSARLQARNYPSFELGTHIFENETHGSGYAAAVSRGLKVLFYK